jgi:hypothetical protein
VRQSLSVDQKKYTDIEDGRACLWYVYLKRLTELAARWRVVNSNSGFILSSIYSPL